MDSQKKHVTYGEICIWLIGTLLLFIPTGLYFYIFIPVSNHSLSDNHAAWASFGSFFGGTIGPVISGLAFFYVWKAYQTQAKQLGEMEKAYQTQVQQFDEMKLSAVREELQRAINETINEIKRLLSHELLHKDKHKIFNTGIALELLFQLNSAKDIDINVTPQLEETIKEIEPHLDMTVVYFLFVEAEHLCFLFDKLIEHNGTNELISAYKRKHYNSIRALHFIGEYNIFLKVLRQGFINSIASHYPPVRVVGSISKA